MSVASVNRLHFVAVGQNDPLAAPLLAEFGGRVCQPVRRDGIRRVEGGWAAIRPRSPGGGLLIGLLDGEPVTGGAFCRFDTGHHRFHQRRWRRWRFLSACALNG